MRHFSDCSRRAYVSLTCYLQSCCGFGDLYSWSLPLYLVLRESSWRPGDIDIYTLHDTYNDLVTAFKDRMNATKINLKGHASAVDRLGVSYGVAIDSV